MATAKAVRFDRTGPISSVLHVSSVQKPTVAAGQSLIQIKASAINPSDCKNVEGSFSQTTTPRTPGRDFAGVVVEGPQAQIGKSVWGTGGTHGYDRDGSHAQYIVVSSDAVQEMPSNLSFVEAAACGVGFLTASLMLTRSHVQKGENILVLGSGGSVGSAAVQLARSRGAFPLESSRSPGTTENIMDLKATDFGSQLQRITQGHGVIAIIDTVGDPTLFAKSLACLQDRGRYVLITAPKTDKHELCFDALNLYRGDKTIIGVNSINVPFKEAGLELHKMKAGFEDGLLKAPQTITEVDLADEKAVVEAYMEVGKGSKGKRVLVNRE